MDTIYYIIIGDMILLFIGYLIACAISGLNKNMDDTAKFIHSMTEGLIVIVKNFEEMNILFEEKQRLLDERHRILDDTKKEM